LIQKRANHIISMPGRWDQSAAGHVDAGEYYATAAKRELMEEMGIENTALVERGRLFSDERDEPDKIKKRFSMLYTGTYNGEAKPNAEEVSEVRWIGQEELGAWMEARPDDFTQGFIENFKYLQSLGN
jgi:16S rRNA (adenine1518-N6/adenine1519-N6)-dimethyltransferase